MNNQRFYPIIGSLLLVGIDSCWAEFENEEAFDFFELPLEELMNLTVDVSTGTAHLIKNSPSSVSVFTQHDIQQMAIETLD